MNFMDGSKLDEARYSQNDIKMVIEVILGELKPAL